MAFTRQSLIRQGFQLFSSPFFPFARPVCFSGDFGGVISGVFLWWFFVFFFSVLGVLFLYFFDLSAFWRFVFLPPFLLAALQCYFHKESVQTTPVYRSFKIEVVNGCDSEAKNSRNRKPAQPQPTPL